MQIFSFSTIVAEMFTRERLIEYEIEKIMIINSSITLFHFIIAVFFSSSTSSRKWKKTFKKILLFDPSDELRRNLSIHVSAGNVWTGPQEWDFYTTIRGKVFPMGNWTGHTGSSHELIRRKTHRRTPTSTHVSTHLQRIRTRGNFWRNSRTRRDSKIRDGAILPQKKPEIENLYKPKHICIYDMSHTYIT